MALSASLSHGYSGEQGDSANGFHAPTINSNSPPNISLSAQASASLTGRFVLAVYGVAGPDTSVAASLGLHINPLGSPKWEVDVDASSAIGLDLNALGVPLLTKALAYFTFRPIPVGRWATLRIRTATTARPAAPPAVQPAAVGAAHRAAGRPAAAAAPVDRPAAASRPPPRRRARSSRSRRDRRPRSGTGTRSRCGDSSPTAMSASSATTARTLAATTTSYLPPTPRVPVHPVVLLLRDGARLLGRGWRARSNNAQWGNDKSAPSGAAIQIGWSGSHPGWITHDPERFPTGTYTYLRFRQRRRRVVHALPRPVCRRPTTTHTPATTWSPVTRSGSRSMACDPTRSRSGSATSSPPNSGRRFRSVGAGHILGLRYHDAERFPDRHLHIHMRFRQRRRRVVRPYRNDSPQTYNNAHLLRLRSPAIPSGSPSDACDRTRSPSAYRPPTPGIRPRRTTLRRDRRRRRAHLDQLHQRRRHARPDGSRPSRPCRSPARSPASESLTATPGGTRSLRAVEQRVLRVGRRVLQQRRRRRAACMARRSSTRRSPTATSGAADTHARRSAASRQHLDELHQRRRHPGPDHRGLHNGADRLQRRRASRSPTATRGGTRSRLARGTTATTRPADAFYNNGQTSGSLRGTPFVDPAVPDC